MGYGPRSLRKPYFDFFLSLFFALDDPLDEIRIFILRFFRQRLKIHRNLGYTKDGREKQTEHK